LANWRLNETVAADSSNADHVRRSREWLESIPQAQRLAVWRLFEHCLGYKAQADPTRTEGQEKAAPSDQDSAA
jgi:hypothetical protein